MTASSTLTDWSRWSPLQPAALSGAQARIPGALADGAAQERSAQVQDLSALHGAREIAAGMDFRGAARRDRCPGPSLLEGSWRAFTGSEAGREPGENAEPPQAG